MFWGGAEEGGQKSHLRKPTSRLPHGYLTFTSRLPHNYLTYPHSTLTTVHGIAPSCHKFYFLTPLLEDEC